MRISDWSSDVCSSDLLRQRTRRADAQQIRNLRAHRDRGLVEQRDPRAFGHVGGLDLGPQSGEIEQALGRDEHRRDVERRGAFLLGEFERSEEHTSELQSLMRISYAVFCLKKKKHKDTTDRDNAIQ